MSGELECFDNIYRCRPRHGPNFLNEFVVGAIKTPRFKNLWFAASAIPETCQGRSRELLAFAADPHHGNAVRERHLTIASLV